MKMEMCLRRLTRKLRMRIPLRLLRFASALFLARSAAKGVWGIIALASKQFSSNNTLGKEEMWLKAKRKKGIREGLMVRLFVKNRDLRGI